MDSPVRKAQKRNDYLRHKLFRKIKRRQRNKTKQDLKIAEKELKRRLRNPKFDSGTDDNKVKVTERTYPDGSVVYFADDGKTLTPINTMDSDDMSNWTWQDTDDPRVTYTGVGNIKDPGEIKQGEGPKSGLGKLHKKLYQVSNRHLQNPVFGAYARFADSWDNDTNPLKAIWEQPATKAAVMELAWAKGLQAANRFKNAAVNYERLGKMAPKELEEFFMSRPDLVRESNRAKQFEAAYSKFADNVVKPKYASAVAAAGREYTPEMDAAISNAPKVYEADFGPYSKWGGYYSTGGGRIMMNSRAAGTDSQLFGRHAHEVHHDYRDSLGQLQKFYPNQDIQTNGESIAQIARSGYTPGEMNTLEAYQFTPQKLKLSPDLKPLWEKGATNAEIASRIYYDTGLTGKELNDAIMKMPKSKLIEYLKTNAYGQSFLKSPWTKDKEKAIRNALTTVASAMPFGVAYNQKYDGGKKAGIDVTYRDAADAYDYLNAHPDASVVLDEQSVVGHAPNARQRLAKYLENAPARYIDRVMLGYLAAGIAPVAMQAAAPAAIAASDAIGGSAAGQVATKALTSPIGKSMVYGTAGATGADTAAKAVTGKTFEEWGEQDLGLPWYLSGFVNPGSYLMPAQGISSRYLNSLGRNTRAILNQPQNGFNLKLPNQYAGLVDFGQDSNEVNLLSSIAKNPANYPGYQIKMLMAGNPLEKQLSKTGMISINSIKALSNKASNVEKSIVEKILNSDKFSGKKNVHYNTFKKAIQDELITYNKVPDGRYDSYGMERLGFSNRQVDDLPSLDTFTFESDRIPVGNDDHYNPSTLGHSRTYVTPDEPDVLHVMESQSDWGQKTKNLTPRFAFKRDFNGNTNVIFDTEGKFHYVNDGQGMPIKEFMNLDLPRDQMPHTIAKRQFIENYPSEQVKYLHDNYLQRQLQENLKYAAEHSQTKMRYPTSETAAKIEGYIKKYPKEDVDEAKVLQDAIFTLKLGRSKLEDLHALRGSEKYLSFNEAENKNDVLKRFSDRLSQLDVRKDYIPEHQTILKKYADFPKLFQKLYKGYNVRTVTDTKGNTWYEVDVPKNYLNQEWQYNSGKDIHIKPSRRGTFTAAAKKHGMSVQAYARKVLKAPKGKYSSAMRKKANFARVFGGRNY